MCISCKKIWTALHVLGSVIYVSTGAVQIVIGIFFVISIPIFSLSSNIWAGSWNVLVGICGGMFACFGKQTAGRQEMLLYLIVAVIIVNTVNAAICEWHFLMANVGDAFADITTALLLGKNSTSELLPDEKNNFINNSNNIYYVVLTTRICAAVVIITAFVDSQFTYCSIQSQNRSQTAKAKKNKGSHEQVSDIEYIIPRPKKNTAPKSNKNIYNAYAQSWVFDADATVSTNNSENSPYLKLDDVIDNNDSTTLSVPTPTKQSLKYDIITRNGSITSSALAFEDTDNILKTPVVHIEEASDDSNSNNTNVGGGVRKLSAMKSFSRTPSPNVLSASSSQVSLVVVTPQIYECLERLTEPSVYRSRLSTAISERDIQQRCISPVSCKSPGHPDSRSPIGGEKVQYASLMQELQQQFMNKKDKLKHQTSSPPSGDHSVTVSDKSSRQEESSSRTTTDPKSNSDAEFSKELEAALQLIQDLESPNTTIETPSEEPPPYRIQKTSNVWHQRGALNVDNNCTITDDNTSESDEKTLSAIGSLAELTSPMTECFPSDVLHTFKPQLHGYSSPTFHNFNGSNNIINNNTHQLSNSSSINGSTNDLGNKLACSILNTKTATIISLRRPINNNLINNDHSKPH
ncbi:uncharacterized protein LOC123295694 isoform X2 [Chrysoperla carnea]|uniref:uncharacterized protein LOC123295694 isoform X2 n=1 Tax=Chrysoperla carnea TaxID=189513 RepID=UPI001D05E311|nr:uncharacterized protein LOC123295694 isoform X2 [Chrysoperla carnea]